jgi:hypothetical protein
MIGQGGAPFRLAPGAGGGSPPGGDLWVRRARPSGMYLAIHQKKALTAAFPLVRGLSVLVGDTGFEPVTSSVSGIFATHDDAGVAAGEVRECAQISYPRESVDKSTER